MAQLGLGPQSASREASRKSPLSCQQPLDGLEAMMRFVTRMNIAAALAMLVWLANAANNP